MNIKQIYEKLPTQNDCLAFLEACFWANSPKCPYCGSEKHSALKNEKRYRCRNCITSYSVTVGTMFHNTRLDIQKWIRLIIIINCGEHYSSRKLGKEIKVTKETALRMKQQISISDRSLVRDINQNIMDYGKK